jgi:hypothetical protein
MIGVQPHFGPDDPDGAAILAGIVRIVLPLIERTGVASAAQVGADTLQQRLSGELAASAAVFAHPMLISAWGTARQLAAHGSSAMLNILSALSWLSSPASTPRSPDLPLAVHIMNNVAITGGGLRHRRRQATRRQ